MSAWQDVMMVCERGHQITDSARDTSRPLPKRCPDCGAQNITACPKCKRDIPGRMHYSNVFCFGSDPVPSHCGECGEPYPWTPCTTTPKDASMPAPTKSNKVFIVHGHDEGMKEATARTLTTLGLSPIILHEMPNEGRTIIEKFETFSDVGYAIILMSPDDMVFPKGTDLKKAKATTYRARPNVVLELGFFIGTLGRKNVFVLRKQDVEIPSDYSGVLYHPYDDSAGKWRFDLVGELKAQGYTVSADALYAKTA